MKRIVWSESALSEFEAAIRYIAGHDAQAARRVAEAIEASIDGLAHRSTGRPGRVEGTYEKSVSRYPYVVAYSLTGDAEGRETVNILHVIHTRRNWPEGSWPSP